MPALAFVLLCPLAQALYREQEPIMLVEGYDGFAVGAFRALIDAKRRTAVGAVNRL